jgi:hypothetical protein
MAKHQRPRAGSRGKSGSRPGGRPAGSRPAGSRTAGAPPRSGGLSAAEEARAAEIEAQLLAREQVADSQRSRSRERRPGEDRSREEIVSRTRSGSLLAIRGEQEYAYVVRDVRRILTVGGSLVGVLLVLFILIEVLGVIHL